MALSPSFIGQSTRTLSHLVCLGVRSTRRSGVRSLPVPSQRCSFRCVSLTPKLSERSLARADMRNPPAQVFACTPRGLFLPSRMMSSGNRGEDKEDESDDDFKPQRRTVSANPNEIAELIQKQITANKIMLYMKGTPAEPRCGFSAQVVRILHAQGVSFSSVNVLDYPSIREGIKNFTDWPTVPQVFVNGEFVGGCDILTQLHQSGELETMFKEANLHD